jgi:hypothetical protein
MGKAERKNGAFMGFHGIDYETIMMFFEGDLMVISRNFMLFYFTDSLMGFDGAKTMGEVAANCEISIILGMF